MNHPHPDKRHVMVTYRRFILGFKKKNGRARGLVHYRELVQTYLTAKRQHLAVLHRLGFANWAEAQIEIARAEGRIE